MACRDKINLMNYNELVPIPDELTNTTVSFLESAVVRDKIWSLGVSTF